MMIMVLHSLARLRFKSKLESKEKNTSKQTKKKYKEYKNNIKCTKRERIIFTPVQIRNDKDDCENIHKKNILTNILSFNA